MMNFATINGITLHYTTDGRAAHPALVFINSLGSDLRIWDEVIPHLADHFFIIRADKRGHGLSGCPPGPYTISQMADDVVGLLDFLGVGTAVPIGISIGGLIALDMAARYPARVTRLILCDTGAVIGTADMWNQRIAGLEADGFTHLGANIVARWLSPAFAATQPAAYQGYLNMLTRTPLPGYTAACQAIRDADLRPAAQTIATPALVLCGAEDMATPPDLGRELAGLLVNGRFQLIPHAAHLPCIEQPEALANEINAFLRSTP